MQPYHNSSIVNMLEWQMSKKTCCMMWYDSSRISHYNTKLLKQHKFCVIFMSCVMFDLILYVQSYPLKWFPCHIEYYYTIYIPFYTFHAFITVHWKALAVQFRAVLFLMVSLASLFSLSAFFIATHELIQVSKYILNYFV